MRLFSFTNSLVKVITGAASAVNNVQEKDPNRKRDPLLTRLSQKMDAATESLILRLQWEDTQQLLRDSEKVREEGRFSDADIALTAYQQSLSEEQSILNAISDAPNDGQDQHTENEGNTSIRLTCVCCNEEKPPLSTFRAPCNHLYCRTCLELLLRYSIDNEALFPPQCCNQDIPAQSTMLYVSASLILDLERKKIEYNTTDRTYCHDSSCSRFIPPKDITESTGLCTSCDQSTCTRCKAAAHLGHCPDDAETQQVVDMGQANGWQRCQRCRRMIQLSTGCHHIQ